MYPIAKNVDCGNQFSSPCDSPLNLLIHLAHIQYLHRAQIIGCWEHTGNRITDSVRNTVPSTSCIRFTKAEHKYQSLVSLDTIH